MKNSKTILILGAFVLTLGLSQSALAFTNYGTNSYGNQCHTDVLNEDGECANVYSSDFTLTGSGPAVMGSMNLAQANSPFYDLFFQKHCGHLIEVSKFFKKDYLSGYCKDRGYILK